MRIYCAVFEEARSSPCRGSGVPCCHDYTPLISIIYIHKIAQRCDIGVLSQHSAEGQATCKNSLRLPIGQAIPFVGGTPLEEKSFAADLGVFHYLESLARDFGMF